MPRLSAALVVLLLGPQGAAIAAADQGSFQRSLELPAHRALARIRSLESTELAPFTTDGCSGGLSTIWTIVADQFPEFAEVHQGTPPWEACCVSHDRVYHQAATDSDPNASYQARLLADQELRACVIRTGEHRVPEVAAFYELEPSDVRRAYRIIADSMLTAVRFGGAPCSGLPWRWGYGFDQCYLMPTDLTDSD